MLADLVSHLGYHFIKKCINNSSTSSPQECKFSHHLLTVVVSNLSFVEHRLKEGILKTGNKAVLVINDFHCMNKKC